MKNQQQQIRTVPSFEKARRPVPGCSNLSIELVQHGVDLEWACSNDQVRARPRSGRPSRLTPEIADALRRLTTMSNRDAAREIGRLFPDVGTVSHTTVAAWRKECSGLSPGDGGGEF
jgi:hypothetical protein